MNSQTCSSRAELEFAEAAIRDVLVDEFKRDAKTDAMSLDRMLVHITNMNEALTSSPESHSNVAKRLDDFATTTAKMAGRNPLAAAKLSRASGLLRAVSLRMRASAAPSQL